MTKSEQTIGPLICSLRLVNRAGSGKAAECVLSDSGSEKNMERAAALYLEAANAGDPESMYRYADCCYYGRGVKKDLELAVEWYQKAADCGHARAQHDLGVCCLYGLGTKRDRKRGRALLAQAEENGYSE